MTIIERRNPIALACAAAFLLGLAGCGGPAGLASAADGGIGGSGNSIGAVSGFGSVIVNGTEFDTTGATIVVDGSGATQSDLRVGHVVVVTANFDDDKATRVEYRAQLKGPVQALNVLDATLGTGTLTVLGQAVATNSATNFSGTQLDPTVSNALHVGDLVEVSGLRDANGVLVATYLERKSSLATYQLIGRVASLSGHTCQVGALTVDYSATSADPKVGDTIEARAPASGFDSSNNTFAAQSVEGLAGPALAKDQALEIEGYVTRYGSASDFDVEGVHTTIDGNTRFEGGSAASLALNVKVEVEGNANASGVLVAKRVEIKATGSVRIEGDVTGIDTGDTHLTVLGVTYAVRPETDLEDQSSADKDPLTFADIRMGDRIEMRGFLEGNSVVASEARREDARPEARLRGRVTAKNAAASQISILGVTVTGNDTTHYQGAADRTAFFATVKVGDFVTADWDAFTATSAPAAELALEND